jgi:hypothetical protein
MSGHAIEIALTIPTGMKRAAFARPSRVKLVE